MMNIDLTAIRQRAEAATEETGIVARLKACSAVVPKIVLARYAMGIGVILRQDIDEAADRIEALERALVMARTALVESEFYIHPGIAKVMVPTCPTCCWGPKQHAPDCKRQQALTEIAGCLGAETAGMQP